MDKKIVVTASVFGIVSIVLGAFGAHGLKSSITAEALQTFEIGVRYQMYHALLLLFVGSSTLIRPKYKTLIFYFTSLGIVLFSGSIYGLATNTLSAFDFKTMGFVTPIGGLLFILAWSLLIVNFVKNKSNLS